jgi:hypothetical protein
MFVKVSISISSIGIFKYPNLQLVSSNIWAHISVRMMNYESTLKTGIILNKLGLSCAGWDIFLTSWEPMGYAGYFA